MSEVAFLSGSNIKLEAPTFLLGDLNKNFVSGSSGNIQISSSQFHVDSKNNIFHMGNLSGSKISFDGSNLEMSSSNFFLGNNATSFISGSRGSMEISSSNFHVSGGAIVAQNITLQNYATADYFNFKNLTIQCDDAAEVGKYFVKYEKSSAFYYALVLNGSRGGHAATFVRINDGADLA